MECNSVSTDKVLKFNALIWSVWSDLSPSIYTLFNASWRLMFVKLMYATNLTLRLLPSWRRHVIVWWTDANVITINLITGSTCVSGHYISLELVVGMFPIMKREITLCLQETLCISSRFYFLINHQLFISLSMACTCWVCGNSQRRNSFVLSNPREYPLMNLRKPYPMNIG